MKGTIRVPRIQSIHSQDMNLIQRILPITAMIALAIPGAAADEVAAELEKKTIAYWAPDAEAMAKTFTEEMGLSEEDAAKAVEESAEFTVHVEKGTVHLYTKQGVLLQPYEIVKADKEAGTLTVRAVGPPDAPKPQPVTIAIKGDRISVQGGQAPFVLKRIGEDEFLKRKAAVPADKVGP